MRYIVKVNLHTEVIQSAKDTVNVSRVAIKLSKDSLNLLARKQWEEKQQIKCAARLLMFKGQKDALSHYLAEYISGNTRSIKLRAGIVTNLSNELKQAVKELHALHTIVKAVESCTELAPAAYVYLFLKSIKVKDQIENLLMGEIKCV